MIICKCMDGFEKIGINAELFVCFTLSAFQNTFVAIASSAGDSPGVAVVNPRRNWRMVTPLFCLTCPEL